MEVIKEIAYISNTKPLKGILLDLYEIVLEKNVTRSNAHQLFLQKGYDNFKLNYKRLKDKLLEGILYNSFPKLSAVQKQNIANYKKYATAKILIGLDQKNAGVKISEEVISKSEKLGNLEIALSLSREMESFFALQQKSSDKFKYYQNKTTALKKAFDEEYLIQKLYGTMLYALRNNKPVDHLFEQLKGMEGIAATNNNYRFRLYYHHCINRMADYEGDFDMLIDNTTKALGFFNSQNTPLPYTTKWIFQINLVPIYINQGHYGLAERTLNACLSLPMKGSINWHITLHYKAILGFYSNKPNIATQAYQTAHSIKQKFESAIIDHRWKMIAAYLSFYHKIGKVHFPKPFRLYRFLNSMPPTKSDTTQRANLMILEQLHLLADKKLKTFTKNTFTTDEKIKNYFNQHAFRRSKYFLRAIRSIVKGNFTKVGATRHAQPHLKKLAIYQLEMDLNVLDRELVPYEFLWEELLELL